MDIPNVQGLGEDKPKKPDIAKLNAIYSEAESADKEVFAEQRSNLLLIAGEHYAKRNSRFFERIRTAKELSMEVKIRLTKNHIQRIAKIYANNILSYAPGVKILPKVEGELQDQKSAQLNDSVWQDAKDRHDINDMNYMWADDFVGIGEVATKCYFDPNGGELLGYEPDEMGQPLMDQPKFRGDILFEEVHGFNILRAPEAKTMKSSPYLIIRKMVAVEHLKKAYPDYSEKIQTTSDRTFLVFDSNQYGYRRSVPTECLVKEFYYRPSIEYPQGYYYIATDNCILNEGELPYGIYPIEIEVFDHIPTTPRGRSIVKQLRPYQAEINRTASKIAEHQMTLGDDKLIMVNGAKMSAGGQVPGVRGITINGPAPTILGGRAGDQYLGYMQSQIAEMYQVAMIAEDSMDAQTGSNDPYAMLFKAASQKKQFKRYIARFENYLKRVCKLYLKFAKAYLPDDAIIMAVGKKEQVNISEFKRTQDFDYQIKVEAQSDDIETLMGKQLVMNHLVQYVGPQLSRDDIGKMIENMPYANVGAAFSDFTLDFKSAENDMLALERGEQPTFNQFDNHEYMVKKLGNRMKQADFKFLHPFIIQNYQAKLQQHMIAIEQNKQSIARNNAGLVPTTGALVDAGIWMPDPQDSTKTKRVRIPQDSLQWLIQKLQDQGTQMQSILSQSPEIQAAIGNTASPEMAGQQGQLQQMPQQETPPQAPPVSNQPLNN